MSEIEIKRKELKDNIQRCLICGYSFISHECKHTQKDIFNLGVEMARREFLDKIKSFINEPLITLNSPLHENYEKGYRDGKIIILNRLKQSLEENKK